MPEGHCKPNMNSNPRSIVTAPVSSDDTGDAGGGSRSPVPLGAERGRSDVEAPRKTRNASASRTRASRDRSAKEAATKTVDVRLLNEDELVGMIRGCVSSMTSFVDKNRNVHKEIKDLVTKTEILVKHLVKVKSVGARTPDITPAGCAGGVTQDDPIASIKVVLDKHNEAMSRMIQEQANLQQQLQKQQEESAIQQQIMSDHYEEWRKWMSEQRVVNPTSSSKAEVTTEPRGEEWETARRSKRRRKGTKDQLPPEGRPAGDGQNRRTREERAEALVLRRTPRSEAVTISEPREGETYASVMKEVVARVKLTEIGVEIGAVRRTRAGGILLQVKNKEEADILSERLQNAVGDKVKIGRPARTTPVLITNIPDWMDDSEVEEQIRASDPALAGVSTRIRENVGGGRVAIINTPLQTASKLAEVGRVKIGWSQCRVKLLERKNPTCYRCRKPGHLKASCRATEAERLCFRCNRGGHLIKDCPGRPPPNLTQPSTSSVTRAEPAGSQGATQGAADHPSTTGGEASHESNVKEGQDRKDRREDRR